MLLLYKNHLCGDGFPNKTAPTLRVPYARPLRAASGRLMYGQQQSTSARIAQHANGYFFFA
jgi:hypothetical protein